MFKLYELITKISAIHKAPIKGTSRGFNIAYQNPKDNRDYLKLVAKNRYNG